MNIGIDLDNCVFDLEPLYKQAFNHTQYSYTRPKKWDIYEEYPKEIADYLLKIFASDAIFYTPLLNQKIPYVLNKLNNIHNVQVITARLGNNKIININNHKQSLLTYKTHEQLKRSNIHIQSSNINVTQKSKINTIKKHKIDIMFDDSPHIIEECLTNNINCVMISNEKTLYNHYLRNKVKYYSDLVTAIYKSNLLQK